jgi:hypothetical protein
MCRGAVIPAFRRHRHCPLDEGLSPPCHSALSLHLWDQVTCGRQWNHVLVSTNGREARLCREWLTL